MPLEITDLSIVPESNAGSPVVARCTATFNSALVIENFLIIQGKKGIFVRFPKVVKPALEESKKSIGSRILATYVINHCMEDYDVKAA
jgi:DNA-binding cell septation regulator SpoVG